MNPAARGAVLVIIAALLGFLILRGAAETSPLPVGTSAAPAPTATPSVDASPVPVTTPTFAPDPASARPNNEVSVLVVNGTEVSNQASRLTTTLRNKGFLTREPRNAIEQAASTIYFRPGFASESLIVRATLGGSTVIAPMPVPEPALGDNIDLAQVDVLVVIGADELSTS